MGANHHHFVILDRFDFESGPAGLCGNHGALVTDQEADFFGADFAAGAGFSADLGAGATVLGAGFAGVGGEAGTAALGFTAGFAAAFPGRACVGVVFCFFGIIFISFSLFAL